jgi:hypothetical protein
MSLSMELSLMTQTDSMMARKSASPSVNGKKES